MGTVISHPAFDRTPVANTRKLGGCAPKRVRILSRYRREKTIQAQCAKFQAQAAETRKRHHLEELKAIRDDHMRKAYDLCGVIVDLERALGLR